MVCTDVKVNTVKPRYSEVTISKLHYIETSLIAVFKILEPPCRPPSHECCKLWLLACAHEERFVLYKPLLGDFQSKPLQWSLLLKARSWVYYNELFWSLGLFLTLRWLPVITSDFSWLPAISLDYLDYYARLLYVGPNGISIHNKNTVKAPKNRKLRSAGF